MYTGGWMGARMGETSQSVEMRSRKDTTGSQRECLGGLRNDTFVYFVIW
jgi:hypothetical protein